MTDIAKSTGNVVKIYFPDGLPTDYAKVKTVAVTPNMISVSPSSGSAGGTLITVTGTGFGTQTANVKLVDSSDADVCQTLTITGYGKFTCLTKAVEI